MFAADLLRKGIMETLRVEYEAQGKRMPEAGNVMSCMMFSSFV